MTEDERRESIRKSKEIYRKSAKGIESTKRANAKYRMSEKGKLQMAEWSKKRNSDRREFRKTEEGRLARNVERKMMYDRSNKYAVNSRSIWTEEEVELVMKHEIPDIELSKKIGRSVRAIQAKRCNELKSIKKTVS